MTDTFLGRIIAGLDKAGTKTSPDQDAPAAVLWPDKERQFEGIISRLKSEREILTLGSFISDASQGPAVWIRCALGAASTVPVVYMPGWTRDDIRDISECPEELQPLADLHFRGAYWQQSNGRDWTITALLENTSVGVGVGVSGDKATKEALGRALPQLLDETVDSLRSKVEIDSGMLNAMLRPDPVRDILSWMSDPMVFKAGSETAPWQAFSSICRHDFRLDPDKDGPLSAAELLGKRNPAWEKVWARFAESPGRYPQVVALLEQAQPGTLIDEHPDSWPAFNTQGEAQLRDALSRLKGMPTNEAASKVAALEADHEARRAWVWARIDRAPLALALEHLAVLAQRVPYVATGTDPAILAQGYAEDGWRTDAAVVGAMAAVSTPADRDAVLLAVDALYRSWLDATARAFQDACASGEIPSPAVEEWPAGTCLVFVDGLRYDVGMSVATALEEATSVEVDWSFAAVPSITATAKRAISPVGNRLTGGPDFDPSDRIGGPALSHAAFKRLLADAGWQYLGESWGDTSGLGWLEIGDIDEQGHTLPMKLPTRLRTEVTDIAGQVRELLAFGWKRVVVVTDHGWLYLPGGLPKVQQSIAALDKRKGRCGRLSPGSTTEFQTLPWYFDKDVRIAIAPGIACFEEGKVYEHGGISPQECVTPVISVTALTAAVSAVVARIASIRWTGMRCRVEIEGTPSGATLDIRTKPADANSSISSGPKPVEGGVCAPIVPDDAHEGTAASVVLLGNDGSVLAQALTTVGGEDR